MATQSVAPAARPILGTNRVTGEFVALVPSNSTLNAYHVTTLSKCDCKGFSFRGKCSHIRQVQAERGVQDGGKAHLQVLKAAGSWPTKPTVSADVAEKAAIYRSIFSEE